MKVVLIMIMCTAMHGECLAPHQMPITYTNYYDCLQAGYKEAINKQIEIGKEDTNKHQIFIRFSCEPANEI